MNKLFVYSLCLFIVSCTVKKAEKSNGGTVSEGRNISCDSGMVVSAHPCASAAGVKILREGGNAIDAAVATEFALAVCYPEAGNIGGGGFMLVRKADGTAEVIDYREKAPAGASKDMYLDKKGEVITGASTETHLASGVPGTVDGLITAHNKYGKLSFKQVIQPAIDLAQNGFPVTALQAADLNSNREVFIKRNNTAVPFVKESPWKAGDTLVQKDLASTLIRIRDLGRNGFYSGVTARLIAAEMKRGNGIIDTASLNAYKCISRTPLKGNYKGYTVMTVPPPSGGGIILLQLLAMTENSDLGKSGFHSSAAVHLIVEAERRAFADRAQFSGDPEFVKVPVKGLTDKKYLRMRMGGFDPVHASPSASINNGDPLPYESEETTHYSVIDSKGNAVATTTTLNNTFGNSIVVSGAGFLLNNEMDDFSVKPGVPNLYGLIGAEANSIAPGKRMLSSMTPAMIEKDGHLLLVTGSPGGSTIPTTVYQVIINFSDYGMPVGKAVDASRFHHQWLPDVVYYEKSSLDSSVIDDLKRMGHTLKERGNLGSVNAISVTADGKRWAGADSRGNNAACGY